MQHEHERGRRRDGKCDGDELEDRRNREITIIVNGREKTVEGREVTFDQIVVLAFDNRPTGEFVCFTITYRHGRGNRPQGTLVEGGTVLINDGMIFNVTATDKS